MKKALLFRLAVLVAAMMCALGAAAAEAYANYTSSNATLTFYYDDLRSSRTGVTYDLNTGSNDPGWSVDPEEGTSPVTKVVFNSLFADARPTTTYSWFYGMENLQSITGIEYLNTSEVTNMGWMFGNCTELTSLDLSHFNTSKVTEMGAMFYCCSSLTSLDLSSFNTSKVTRMPGMFNRCTNLRTVYVSHSWSTTAVTYSANMFSDCTSLVGGQGTTYNSSNPTDKTYAHIDGGPSNPGYFTRGTEAYACYTSSNTTLTFYYDTQRSSRTGTTYDLNTGSTYPAWKTDGTNVSVTRVVFDPSFADARPTTTYGWFYKMVNLQSITGMSYLNTSEVTDMRLMFMFCTKLTSLEVGSFNTANVVAMGDMFRYCYGLTSLDLSNFNTSKVTSMNYMFSSCYGLTSLDLSNFNTSKVTDMSGMFDYCISLTSLDLSSFNTANVVAMGDMFWNNSNLRTVYVGSNWSTAAVTNSDDMFYNCTSLVGGQGTTYNASNPKDKTYAHIDGGTSNPGYFTEKGPESYACYTPSNTTLTFYYDSQRSSRPGTTYDLNTGSNDPDWITDGTKDYVTKVVFDPSFADARPMTTYYWFYSMVNLQTITGMNYLNTSEVTRMVSMFCDCANLTSLDVSHFNTSHVTSMRDMFFGCSRLTSLDLSNFNTAKVEDMSYMFYDCRRLTSLDLSSFNTSQVIDMGRMFYGCSNLRTIYVGNGWTTEALLNSTDMFKNCTSLVGGQGTTYNASNPTNKTYAHIDGGPSNPGYFTAKNAGLRGDVNGDGSVNISDVTTLIDLLLGGGSISNPAADCNQDSSVNISDVTSLIDYLLSNHW